MAGTDAPDLRALTDETRDLWDAKADYWDERMGEGNAFHRQLVGPAVERLLTMRPDETILDIACGNGQFARRMADLGARVVATDFSSRFLERARARSQGYGDRIEYRQLDATDAEALTALGDGRYDAAVCLMALMDMTTIEPLMAAIPRLLKPGGRFVFAIQHPCFNSNGVAMISELEDVDGEERITHSLKLRRYLTLPPARGMGMPGEPTPHYYFHRPLHEVLGIAFRYGLMMDGIEEPAFPAPDEPRPFSWLTYSDIPPVFAARLRVPGTQG